MGKLFCFRWFKTEKSKRESFGGIKEGSEWPKASAPSMLPEKRETHTHATPLCLYEEIQSGHIVRKTSATTCFYIFFPCTSL